MEIKRQDCHNKKFSGMVPVNYIVLYLTLVTYFKVHIPDPVITNLKLLPLISSIRLINPPPHLSSDLSSVHQNLSRQDYHLLVLHLSLSLTPSRPSSTSSDSKGIILITSLLQFPHLPFALFSSPRLVKSNCSPLLRPPLLNGENQQPGWLVSL